MNDRTNSVEKERDRQMLPIISWMDSMTIEARIPARLQTRTAPNPLRRTLGSWLMSVGRVVYGNDTMRAAAASR